MTARYRLARLLGKDGRCFDVAIDHGVFGTASFLPGIENMARAVEAIVEAAPDAVQLAPGHAPLLQARPGREKPALVLRVDISNVYGPNPPSELFCTLLAEPVERAFELDAACVVAFLLDVPERPDLHRQCIENLSRLGSECARRGMPLMVEPIAMTAGRPSGYAVDGTPHRIAALVRQAVELGADIIKADPTDPLDELPRIVELAGGRPLLVRGGGRETEEVILRRTAACMSLGASGIVYGRNVIQHPRPSAITRAFMAIVHEGATPEDALARLHG